ncbi:hypothetical protein [Yinghuangia aomiensis]|uniref:hypothetical protein n=1 Tax=Yinghuangia aomiensis TaxID=676205 RepID=UPI0031ECC4FE
MSNVHARFAMEILGHSQVSATMVACTHVPESPKREAVPHIDRMLHRRRTRSPTLMSKTDARSPGA